MSVHLNEWPEAGNENSEKTDKLILDMKETRRLVTLALESRSKANIKVRQPLSMLKIKCNDLKPEFLEIIKDELNVKEVEKRDSLEGDIFLDTTLTPELLEEGKMRDLIRSIQELRKEKDLKPQDVMPYTVSADQKELFEKFEKEIKSVTNIEYEL